MGLLGQELLSNSILFGKEGGGALKGIVPIFIQLAQPTTNVVGAIWIESSIATTKDVLICQDVPADVVLADTQYMLRITAGTNVFTNMDANIKAKNNIPVRFAMSKGTNPWTLYNDTNMSVKAPYPDNVLVRQSGAWQGKNGYYWNGASWVKFYTGYYYMYNAGFEFVPFSTALIYGGSNAIFTKYANRMNLYARGPGNPESTKSAVYVTTTTLLNLTGVKKIWVDWEATFPSGFAGYCGSILELRTSITGYQSPIIASLGKTGPFTRMADFLNVSTIGGSYYIGIVANNQTSDLDTQNTIIYSIWLEY